METLDTLLIGLVEALRPSHPNSLTIPLAIMLAVPFPVSVVSPLVLSLEATSSRTLGVPYLRSFPPFLHP